MKVVYFSQDYTPHDHRFLEALAGTNHEVHFLRLEDRGLSLELRPVPAGIVTVNWWGGTRPVGRSEYPRAIEAVKDVLNELQPDLVHAGPVQGPAYLTAMAGFRPLVTMSWGSDLLQGANEAEGQQMAQVAIQASELLLTDSQVVTDKAIELGGDPDRIVVFPWGVDLNRFHPGSPTDLREKLGWEDKMVLISIRSWEPVYGIECLIRGFIEAAGELPQIRMVMLGNGQLADWIRTELARADLTAWVHFPGQIPNSELPGYYRAADLYVSASQSDGSSISLLEAMASGLPALASDIPGNAEWIEPGSNGWLFRDGDAGDLAEKLVLAAGHPGEMRNYGEGARQVAEIRADWSQNFAKLLEAYELAVHAHV